MTGASGSDMYRPVPPGTEVLAAATGELLGEVLQAGNELLVAKGPRRSGWQCPRSPRPPIRLRPGVGAGRRG